MERRDPYRILQVHTAAEPEVLAAAYRVLARKLHPDGKLDAELPPGAARRMADLNWAYDTLRDPVKRARFEVARYASAPPTPAHPRTHGAERPPTDLDPGDAKLDFGRYNGWTLREVGKHDLEYLRWLSRHASGARYRAAISQLLHERRPRPGAGR